MVRRDSHLDILQLANDRLELLVVYSVEWLDNLKRIILRLILFDLGLDGRKVLLVTHVDVVEEWALTR